MIHLSANSSDFEILYCRILRNKNIWSRWVKIVFSTYILILHLLYFVTSYSGTADSMEWKVLTRNEVVWLMSEWGFSGFRSPEIWHCVVGYWFPTFWSTVVSLSPRARNYKEMTILLGIDTIVSRNVANHYRPAQPDTRTTAYLRRLFLTELTLWPWKWTFK